jgi:hypothetical protein
VGLEGELLYVVAFCIGPGMPKNLVVGDEVGGVEVSGLYREESQLESALINWRYCDSRLVEVNMEISVVAHGASSRIV